MGVTKADMENFLSIGMEHWSEQVFWHVIGIMGRNRKS